MGETRGVNRFCILLVLVAFLACQQSEPEPVRVSHFKPWGAPVTKAKVLGSFPHDRASFTQGLLFHQGKIFEGTGRRGQSRLARLDLETGEVEQERRLDPSYFGEGLALVGEQFFQLTWTSSTAFVYNLDFSPAGERMYIGQGWGLTERKGELIKSNGSATLEYLKPSNFRVLRTVEVKADGRSVANLNELEMVGDELWANVYTSDFIVRVEPESGRVLGWLDCSELLSETERRGTDVLNGIAYDEEGQRLFVTGKLWPKLFEIEIPSPESSPEGS